MICPFCGGQNEEGAHLCKWCHAELTDLSLAHHEEKKAAVKTQIVQLKHTPKKIATIMTLTFLLLMLLLGIGGTVFSISTGKTFKDMAYDFKLNLLDYKLNHYYKTQDYDGLEKLVIDEAHTTLASDKYFAYRRALFTYWFHSDFEKAHEALQSATTVSQQNEAISQMLIAYKQLYDDETDRKDSLEFGYLYIDEIDAAFNEEFTRQAQILNTLLDCDLETIVIRSDSTIEHTNWSMHLKEEIH